MQLSLPSGHIPLNKERRDLPKSSFNVKEYSCKAQGWARGSWLRRASAPGKVRQEEDGRLQQGFLPPQALLRSLIDEVERDFEPGGRWRCKGFPSLFPSGFLSHF